MVQKFLRCIAFMVMLIAVGTLDLFYAITATNWWILVFDVFGMLIAYFAAWLNYRDARKIAKSLDEPAKIQISIEQFTREASQSDTKETKEDHEDIGPPV